MNVYHLRLGGVRLAGGARLGGALVLAGAGLVLTAGAASASSAGAAQPTADVESAPVGYSCDLSGYGQGLAALSINASISAPSQVTAGTAVTVTLVTSGIGVPTATASMLPAMSYLGIAGGANLSGASQGSASLTGQSGYLGAAAGAMSEIPALTAMGSVTASDAGTVWVTAPGTFQLVPSGGSGKLPAITCTAASAVSVRVAVLANGSGSSGGSGTGGTGSGGTGTSSGTATAGTQTYSCTVSVAAGSSAGAGSSATPTSMLVPMRLAYSGSAAVAAPEQVSISSTALGGTMADASPMASSASLGLATAGARTAAIPLTASMRGDQLTLAGEWQPLEAGAFRLVAPRHFGLRLRETTSVTVVVVCTATTVRVATTTVHVAVSAMSSAAAGGIAASETTSSPAANAPATGAGGSLYSAPSIALLTVGGVAVLAGMTTIGLAIFRRRGGAMAQ
jgi:hypothetical protein